jgi:hypothetical protein
MGGLGKSETEVEACAVWIREDEKKLHVHRIIQHPYFRNSAYPCCSSETLCSYWQVVDMQVSSSARYADMRGRKRARYHSNTHENQLGNKGGAKQAHVLHAH